MAFTQIFATTITINGTPYDEVGRVGVGLFLDSWGWDLDDDLSCEFHEGGPNCLYPGQAHWQPNQSVSITTSGTTRFFGVITSVTPQFTSEGWTWAYRCRGPRYLADNLYVANSDGTGTAYFNLDPDDDDYIASLAGQSIGQILSYFLTLHSSSLSAIGVTTDSTTASQLAAMTLVPPSPVLMSDRLWQAIEGLLRSWAGNYVPFIGADGLVRFFDSTAFTPTTITLDGSDPVMPVRFAVDVADCASRVVVRGSANVAPFYARLSTSQIAAAWSSTQQSAWTYADYNKPADAYDTGTISSITSTTTAVLLSADNTRTAATNFWSGRQAWLHLFKSGGMGITFSESRPVTANTAETAGATFTVTLGYPLDNSATHSYDTYALIGTAAPLSTTTGRVDVWRLFNVPNTYVSAHLVKAFPTDVAFFGFYGDSVVLTRYPSALIVDPSGATFPASFKILPQTGQIRFDEPVVKALNTTANLALGGSHVTAPSDILVLLAYSRGPLTATYPPDSSGSPVYGGTSYATFGLQRTRYIDVPAWVYQGNAALFVAYAQQAHTAIKDAIYTGSVQALGAATSFFFPGLSINLASARCTTGQESAAVPVRSFRLRYFSDGSGGVLCTSEMRCSSRRNQATGDRYYVHPTSYRDLIGRSPLQAEQLDFSKFLPMNPFTAGGSDGE